MCIVALPSIFMLSVTEYLWDRIKITKFAFKFN